MLLDVRIFQKVSSAAKRILPVWKGTSQMKRMPSLVSRNFMVYQETQRRFKDKEE